ncbi:hypothetical protein BDB01DRAFT_831828 [Pilobolus umbonatus]|nr:hypothetical protein BDB01DRAFT_831828 [Pilobolus umbonatus]
MSYFPQLLDPIDGFKTSLLVSIVNGYKSVESMYLKLPLTMSVPNQLQDPMDLSVQEIRECFTVAIFTYQMMKQDLTVTQTRDCTFWSLFCNTSCRLQINTVLNGCRRQMLYTIEGRCEDSTKAKFDLAERLDGYPCHDKDALHSVFQSILPLTFFSQLAQGSTLVYHIKTDKRLTSFSF